MEVTSKLYREITGNRDTISLPCFTIEEIVSFLTGLGYEIIIHTALAKHAIKEWEYERSRTVGFEDVESQTILAVRGKYTLPKRLDDSKCNELFIITVFEREIKKKLLTVH